MNIEYNYGLTTTINKYTYITYKMNIIIINYIIIFEQKIYFMKIMEIIMEHLLDINHQQMI